MTCGRPRHYGLERGRCSRVSNAYPRQLFAEMPKAKTIEDFEALLPFNTAPQSQLPLTRNSAVFRSRT